MNVDKSQLGRRSKLQADRFKAKEQKGKSKVEQEILKKMAKNPVQVKAAPKSELEDIWGAKTNDIKWVSQFKAFSKKEIVKVKAIQPALPGHSFNPSAKAHEMVLRKVLHEEERQIEEEMANIKQQGYEQKASKGQDEAIVSEEEPDSDNMEVPNKPVDRLKIKTKQVRNNQVSFAILITFRKCTRRRCLKSRLESRPRSSIANSRFCPPSFVTTKTRQSVKLRTRLSVT